MLAVGVCPLSVNAYRPGGSGNGSTEKVCNGPIGVTAVPTTFSIDAR